MVKQLRELTGAPMMDCKKALQAEGVDGNIEKAVEDVLKDGYRTIDIMSEGKIQIGTSEMGDRICEYIQ